MLQAIVRRLFGKRTMPEIRRDVVRESAAPGYRPPRFSSTHELLVDELPVFNYFMMRLMLRDPVVQMGLSTRNAAMISGEVQVTASDPKITEFVQDQYRKIWTNYGHVIRRTKRWGFQGLEVILRRNPDTGFIEVGELRDFAPIDVVALTLPQHNHPVGMAIKNSAFYRDMVDQPTNRLTNVRLFAPNMIWLTYDGHWQNHWGHSIMRHSYASWYEKWMAGGAKKVQQLRMIKDAYIGEMFKVPVGKTIQDPDNENRAFSWRQFAFEWAENRLAGGVGVIPNVFDDEGRSLVEYIPPSDTGNPTAIFEWGDRLDDEILKGMAVTPEVLQAAATGSGFSGRSIPLSMFLQSVGEEFKDYIAQIKLNLIDMLVFLNFGGEKVYDVEAVSLLETFSTEMGGSPMGGEAFGGQASSPFGQPPGGDTLGVQFGETQKKKAKDVHVIGWDSLDEIVNVGVFATEQKRAELSEQVESEIAKHSTLNVGLLVAVGAVLNAFRTPLGEIVSQLMDASAKAGLLEVGRMAPESLAVGYASREQLAVQSTGPGVSAAHTVNPPAPVVLYRDTQPAAPTAPTSSEPSAIIGPSLRFPNLEKAVSDMGAKSVMQSGHYLEAASHVKRGYFSITADLTDKQLMQIRDILQDHIDNGGTVDAFKREVVNLLGSSKAALSPNHLTTVYRAATMGALSDASHFHLSKMQLQFPYRRYAATHDDRVRKTHEAIETSGLNGTAIFRADDPFWLEIRPPWDYGCRCNWSPVSITQAAAAGVTEAREWLARAKAMAKENGGHFGLYYAETAPDEPEHVKRPKVDGEPIKASKAWQRDGVQFSDAPDPFARSKEMSKQLGHTYVHPKEFERKHGPEISKFDFFGHFFEGDHGDDLRDIDEFAHDHWPKMDSDVHEDHKDHPAWNHKMPTAVAAIRLNSHMSKQSRSARRKAALAELAEMKDQKVLSYAHKDGTKLVVHPATRTDGKKWQVTRFVNHPIKKRLDPLGHTSFDTREEAVKAVTGTHEDSYWDEGNRHFKLERGAQWSEVQFSSLFDDDGEFRFKSDSPPKVTPAPPRAPAKPSSLFDIRSPGQPAKEFDESKHPRDSKGKFANKFGRTVGDEVTVHKGDHPLTVTGFDGERVEWKQKETGQTGVTHHKDFLEHNKYRLTRSNVDDLQAKVDKLNARAEKKGLDGRVWMKVSEEPHQTDHEIDSGDRLAWIASHRLRESHKKNLTGRIQQRFLVEVGGEPPSYKGWTFAAKLEPFAISVDGKEKTINLVQAANHDIDVDDRFTDMVGNCEHCNTKRKRRHTYVLNHEDGSQVCVGKSCLKDFLGHDNPNKFANYFDWLDSIHEDARQASGGEGADGYEGGPRGPVEYETDDALAWAAASVRKLGFKAKSYDEYNNTASHVSYLLNPPGRHTKAYEEWQEERDEFRPTEKDKEKVKLAREWIANEDVTGSSYLKKLQVVSSGIVQRGSTLGVAASLIRAYDLAQGNDDKPDSDKPKALNEWFGKPRERVEVELEPVRFRGFAGAYGSGTVCTFRDNEGRTFVWFASGDKDEDDLPKGKYKATIKEHDEYSGTKQTIINRVKPA